MNKITSQGVKMLITIDIGNSSISIGYFTDYGFFVQKMPTHPMLAAAKYRGVMRDFLKQNHIEKSFFSCIISSVVTSHTAVLKDAAERLFDSKNNDVIILSHQMDTGLDLKIKVPEEVGADRLSNAAGAYALYHGPVIVVDFGSATTITVVGVNADFLGGSIMPGIGLMNDVLARRTSRLTKVSFEQAVSVPGKDTAECIRSGLLIGTAGAVERLIDEIEKEVGQTFRVVITGGYAHLMDKFIKRPHDVNVFLIHEGLREIYGKNRPA